MSGDRGGVRLRRGRVVSIGTSRPGALELEVELEGDRAPALAYPVLTGPVAEGDSVVLNTTAVSLGLGTGGMHLVVAVEGARPIEEHPPGRVMKARYTPLQVAVRTLEETHRDIIDGSNGLQGVPVVCAPLHSMIAPIAAGAKAAGAERVVYVMTDGAALPGWFSRLVPALQTSGLLDGFITCGQAFGGTHEAVTLWTALLGAREVLDADVVVVADGPGNLGTETRWGVSALGSGVSLNAASLLGGRPVAALRISFADDRPRHRGVSHHSLTILGQVCMVEVDVAVPVLEGAERDGVWEALRTAALEDRHRLVEADGRPGLAELERVGIQAESMGRTPAEDPAFFLAAGAAGVLAGRMAAGARAWRGR